MRKADLQPVSGEIPNHVALDETVIPIDDERYWLYAAVNPEANKSFISGSFPRERLP